MVGVGVEPSRRVLAEGKRLYPKIHLRRGLAESLPVTSMERFDLVIVNFVLHWVARASLMKALAEVDRVVSDSGYLILADFFPDLPTRVRYHHLIRPRLYTYKVNYTHLFESTGLYHSLHQIIYDVNTRGPARLRHIENRAKCVLLRKSYQDFYIEKQLK